MRFIKFAAAVAMASLLLAGSTLASERGTPDEAKALVEKAAAHLQKVGHEKAFADFNNPTGGYVDRDLFVFVYSLDGVIVSAGANTALLGKNAGILKDIDGKEFGKMIIAAAHKGGGWSDYRMVNPVTKKPEPKTTYAVKAGDYIVASGAYKP
jgi:signal transduction histidine kinase